jgi:hypothetical protein
LRKVKKLWLYKRVYVMVAMKLSLGKEVNSHLLAKGDSSGNQEEDPGERRAKEECPRLEYQK